MKPSEFYVLVATIYLAPQLPGPVGAVAGVVFMVLAVLMVAAKK